MTAFMQVDPYSARETMTQEKNTKSDAQKQETGEGHLLMNIGKMVFLIAVLVAFWYLFDKWIGSK
jgi:hypothetical protein